MVSEIDHLLGNTQGETAKRLETRIEVFSEGYNRLTAHYRLVSISFHQTELTTG